MNKVFTPQTMMHLLMRSMKDPAMMNKAQAFAAATSSKSQQDPIAMMTELIEGMKDRKKAREWVGMMETFAPDVVAVLLESRDEYMTKSLKECKGKTILGTLHALLEFPCD